MKRFLKTIIALACGLVMCLAILPFTLVSEAGAVEVDECKHTYKVPGNSYAATHTTGGLDPHYACATCPGRFATNDADAEPVSINEFRTDALGHVTAEYNAEMDRWECDCDGTGSVKYYAATDAGITKPGPNAEPVGGSEPTDPDLDSSEPDSSEPDSSEPDSSEPDSSEPDSSEPDSSEPDSSEPDSSEPDSSEPTTGHSHPDAELVTGTPATHTTNGVRDYYYCADCDGKFESKDASAAELTDAELVLLATGHIRAELVAAVPATHTANGVAAYYYCADCDGKFESRAPEAAELTDEELVILATGHVRAEKVEAVAATHTTNGNVEYYYCAECDANYTGRAPEAEELSDEEVTILAAGHIRAEWVEAIPAGHTTNGTAGYWYCAECDDKFDDRSPDAVELKPADLVLLATGHIRAELVEAVPATHTENGTAAYYYCAECDAKLEGRDASAAELTEEELVILAQGHIRAELVTGTPATHTENGVRDYYYCADCDAKFEGRDASAAELTDAELVILAQGHIRAELVAAVPATHTANGVAAYYYCADCDAKFESRAPEAAELTDADLVVLATGHIRAELVEAVPATHTTNGVAAYYYCAECDDKLDGRGPDAVKVTPADLVLLATGHIRAELVEAVPATHTTNGTAAYYYCAECDAKLEGRAAEAAELTDADLVILAQGHIRAELVTGTPATHTENGVRDYYYCADCDAKFEGRDASAAELTDAELVILAQGHIRAELVAAVPATHTKNGVAAYYYCAECDAKFEGRAPEAAELTEADLVVLATGHIRAELVEAVPATHTTNGTAAYYYCAECDDKLDGRGPDAVKVTPADLVLLATGHIRAELVEAVPATHTTNGTAAYYYCAECDAKFEGRAPEAAELTDEELVILATGHIRAELVAGTPATHTENGVRDYYYCAECDGKFEGRDASAAELTEEELVLLATGHIRAELVKGTPATHTENGVREFYYCAECDAKFEGRAPEAAELSDAELVLLATGHVRAELVEAVAATHTTNGSHAYYYCAECDAKFEGRAPEAAQFTEEELVILAEGHIRAELVTGTPATHTENGVRDYYYCAECDAKLEGRDASAAELTEEELVILAQGHIRAELVTGTPATHTENGTRDYYYCAECDAKFEGRDASAAELTEEELVILAQGHIRAEKIDAVAPTHTTNGTIEYYYCDVCDDYYSDRSAEADLLTAKDLIVEALGHIRAEKHEAVEPTHTTDGNVEYWYCSVCDANFTGRTADSAEIADEVIPALGHVDAEYHAAVPANHTTAGTIEYWYCAECDANYDSDKADAKVVEDIVDYTNGHVGAVYVAAVPATHTTNGMAAYYNCEVCGNFYDSTDVNATELTAKELVLLATGHIRAEKVEAVDPTHTTNGNIEYYYCAECDANYTGRAPEAEELSDEEVTISALGHGEAQKVEAVAATHTTNGNIEYYYCADCESDTCTGFFTSKAADAEELTEAEVTLVATGHTNAVWVAAVPATHTANGTRGYYNCTDCGHYYESQDASAEPLTVQELVLFAQGHIRAELVEAVPATHTENGNIEYYYCAECDANYTGRAPEAEELSDEEVTILATGHIRAELVTGTPATHTENGVRDYYYCADCDGKFEGRDASAAELTDAELVILAQGHIRAELVAAVPATHTENGVAAYYYCAECDAKFEGRAPEAAELSDADLVILSEGHVGAELVAAIPATHTENGVAAYYYCAECDDKLDGVGYDALKVTPADLVILASGHIRAEKVAAVAPTCTEKGSIEYWYCAECDAKFEGRAVEAKEYTEKDIAVPAAGHKNATWNASKPATHTEDGNIGYWTCGVEDCGAMVETLDADAKILSEADILIKATGHGGAKHVEAVAPTHTKDGTIAYYDCAECKKMYDSADAGANVVTNIKVPATGHTDANLVEAKAATHTANGNVKYYDCNVCKAKYDGNGADAKVIADVVIKATGHTTAVYKAYVEAKHTEAGVKAHWHCEECGKNYETTAVDAKEIDVVIPATGHTFAEQKSALIPATHTEKGCQAYWYCEVCEAYFNGVAADAMEFEEEGEWVILPMGHVRAEKVEAVAPTHTANGNIEYYYCKECDANFEGIAPEAELIPAGEEVVVSLGHERAEKHAAVAATHTTAGNSEYYYCGGCEKYFDGKAYTAKEIAKDSWIIAATGHTGATKVAAVAPTHTKDGSIEYYDCKVCNKKYDSNKADAEEITNVKVAALGHVTAVAVEAVAATHTKDGNVKYYACDYCGKNYDSTSAEAKEIKDVVIKATGHGTDLVSIAGTPATHTTAGEKAHFYCTTCEKNYDANGKVLSDADLVIKALGHVNATKVNAVEPTCTLAGNKAYYYCSACGKNYDGNGADAKEVVNVSVAAKGHTLTYVPEIKASLTADGVREYWYCSECNTYFADKDATIAVQLTDLAIPKLEEEGIIDWLVGCTNSLSSVSALAIVTLLAGACFVGKRKEND